MSLTLFLGSIAAFLVPTFLYAVTDSDDILEYDLRVSFDISASTIQGVATIPVAKGRELKLDRGRLDIVQVSMDGVELRTPADGDTVTILPSRDGSITLKYQAKFGDEEPSNVISGKGLFLGGTWYPRPEQMCRYRLTVTLPEGYEAISEADVIEKRVKRGSVLFIFHFPHPVDGINLVASQRYRVVEDRSGSTQIFAYFFPEDSHLVRTYLDRAKGYLKLYERLIDPYPYKRFSIVENFLPTGYSMPTYTVLGQSVVRLPFISETSLGHEILHQWFGNSVYIDYAKGNWAEGLTSFLADHFYEQEKGRGSDYRKRVLSDYQSYVNDTNEIPLRLFRGRMDQASRAIGYGKTLMVFQMLKERVGEDPFYEALRDFAATMRFKRASWDDIRTAFEKHHRQDLGPFFHQWVDGLGLPELRLESVETKPAEEHFNTFVKIQQIGKAYTLDIPVSVYSETDKIKHLARLSKQKEQFEISTRELPLRIVVDEEYVLGRKLSMEEFPPVIARLLGDKMRIVVLPKSQPERYENVIRAFKARGDRISNSEDVHFEDLKSHSLVLLGADNPVVAALYGAVRREGGFSLSIKELPWNRAKVAGIMDGLSKAEVDEAFPKVQHYGGYTQLSFDRGTNTHKAVAESSKGITEELHKKTVAVDLSSVTDLPRVLERVADRKIIYVGETHNKFSHHLMQLEIIKALHRKGKKIAIGMEMFQRPFQTAIDDYIDGKIDEKTFLKRSEYFKRWGFDYGLYRPILLFARSEKIPVIALNQKQEVVDKVSRNGLESLSAEEKMSIPSQIDFSDEPYRERLKKVFEAHKTFELENFDFFYQAQVLWDETMSESIANFLKLHPDYQVVVLAGVGHLMYGSGIPKRTERRTGSNYAIILNEGEIEKGIADFILYPADVSGGTSPKLMVFLKEEKGRVAIESFLPKSASKEAGMETADIILAIDGVPVQTIDDIKIELLSKQPGNKVKVRVLRKSLLGLNKELDFSVVLQ